MENANTRLGRSGSRYRSEIIFQLLSEVIPQFRSKLEGILKEVCCCFSPSDFHLLISVFCHRLINDVQMVLSFFVHQSNMLQICIHSVVTTSLCRKWVKGHPLQHDAREETREKVSTARSVHSEKTDMCCQRNPHLKFIQFPTSKIPISNEI